MPIQSTATTLLPWGLLKFFISAAPQEPDKQRMVPTHVLLWQHFHPRKKRVEDSGLLLAVRNICSSMAMAKNYRKVWTTLQQEETI